MDTGLIHYLIVAAVVMTIGVIGIVAGRRSIVLFLMSIQLMLIAVSINFVAFGTFLSDLTGQIFALFVLAVMAAEIAIGLAILIVYFRCRKTIDVETINRLKG
ncbi:MAG: NADH-quinone oxidoreductase subunit NuoK [Pseudomonadota bacterium]|nr:NADH-quinone oxidoreductase subunit NuoK [Pseudomonadota bacterium]